MLRRIKWEPLLVWAGWTLMASLTATMLGAALFLKEPLTRRHVVGLSISVVGAALAVLGDSPRGLAGFTLDAGEPMVFVAAFCLAFYTIASKRFLSTEVSPVLNIAVLLIVGALCLAPFALFARFPTTPPSLEVLGSIAGISIGSTLIGYLFWLRAGQVLGVDRPNRLFNFIPVLTMIITWMAGVAPYPEQIIGAVLVVAGVTVASIGGKSSNHPPGHT